MRQSTMLCTLFMPHAFVWQLWMHAVLVHEEEGVNGTAIQPQHNSKCQLELAIPHIYIYFYIVIHFNECTKYISFAAADVSSTFPSIAAEQQRKIIAVAVRYCVCVCVFATVLCLLNACAMNNHSCNGI